MVKLNSKTIVFAALVIVVIWAIVLKMSPSPPAVTSHKVRVQMGASSAIADTTGVTQADYSARFIRYVGGNRRNPFTPLIASSSGAPDDPSNGWSLTGINTIDGVTSAVLENSGTGDTAFVKPGDRWNGLRVVSIGMDNVILQSGAGLETVLSFPADAASGPDDSPSSLPNGAPGTTIGLPGNPGGQVPLGLPPAPISNTIPAYVQPGN